MVLGQPNHLREWNTLSAGVASALVEVECLRTLDRLKRQEGISDADLAVRREAVLRLIEEIETVDLTRPVLARASQPLPTALGTLDAIHLATALLWQEKERKDLVMATHDTALGIAARACGLRVVGV
jgi:predicted nucleic acid-binding protein